MSASARAPDLSRRVVVTGSSSGIAKQAAVGLARMAAHAVFTSRSAPKGELDHRLFAEAAAPT